MDTKDKILKAARELFFKHGIKSITMDDIAKHIAVSKKTIYQFFANKDEIIIAMTDLSVLHKQTQITAVADDSLDAIQEIMETMKHMRQMFLQMNPNLFYDLQKYYPKAWEKFVEFKGKFILTIIEKNLQKGIKQGVFRKNINIKILSKLRVEEVEMALNPAVFPPEKYNLAQVQIALLDHFLHGIATLNGHELINKYKQDERMKGLED